MCVRLFFFSSAKAGRVARNAPRESATLAEIVRTLHVRTPSLCENTTMLRASHQSAILHEN